MGTGTCPQFCRGELNEPFLQENQYPWMVRLEIYEKRVKWNCGGTLISSKVFFDL